MHEFSSVFFLEGVSFRLVDIGVVGVRIFWGLFLNQGHRFLRKSFVFHCGSTYSANISCKTYEVK